MKASVALTLLVIGFLGFRQVVRGAAYTFTPIDAPGSIGTIPGLETAPHSINDLGQIVGSYYSVNDNLRHGFLYTNGVFSTIDAPGGGSPVLNHIIATRESGADSLTL